MEIASSNPLQTGNFPQSQTTFDSSNATFDTAFQVNSRQLHHSPLDPAKSIALAATDRPLIDRIEKRDENPLTQSKPQAHRSRSSKSEAIGSTKARDELTGLHHSNALVSDDRSSEGSSFSQTRVAGLPYPGRLLKYTPGAPLKYDAAARQWQIRMQERGWTINVDGYYGAESARICKQFQQEKRLQADGIVGPATWAAAFRSDNITSPKPNPGGTSAINQKGLDIVKRFEGLSLTAYRDPVGIWTIGYGHTGPEVGPGDRITRTQAETLLRKDLTRFENAVRSLVKVPLNSNQFSALVSFTFNVGSGALAQSTLLSRLNQRDYQGAADQFSRWVYGGGQVLPGLVTRRNAERALFQQAV